MPLFYKDPDEKLDYTFEWDIGTDTIASSVWSISPTGPTIVTSSFSNATEPRTATVWISGGTQDAEHTLRNFITTAGGREDEQNATLRIATEIVPVGSILRSLPGGDGFDTQEAREIIEGWIARVKAAAGLTTFPNEPYARMVVRRGARAEVWGEILRQSGHLASDEASREEQRADKVFEEYDRIRSTPEETSSRITTRLTMRG